MKQTFPLHDFHEILLSWWQNNGRVLPWRTKLSDELPGGQELSDVVAVRERAFHTYMATDLRRDPYRVVVAEMMLQQTQVDRVIPKFHAWMEKWPKVEDLAVSSLAEVLILWQGLGYNRRARFLWLLAKDITENQGGIWPVAEEELLKLPGLGKYTSRAVMSFAQGQQVAVVDTNVKRVLRRIIEGKEAGELPVPSEKEWFQFADSVLPAAQADPWNQLVMDLGAMVCTAKSPRCEACPVQNVCEAQQLALSKGFDTYRDYLNAQPKRPKKTSKTVRFEDTDRFFRGRIMDLLRSGSLLDVDLQTRMAEEHGLIDEIRFKKLLNGLIKEGLASQKGVKISLG